MAESLKNGADGIYSGIFTPDEVRIYLNAAEKMIREGSIE